MRSSLPVIALLLTCLSSLQAQDLKFNPRKLIPPLRAITDAKFIQADETGDKVSDKELVIGVVIDGRARAYPINMLTGPRREIINDHLGGESIAATW